VTSVDNFVVYKSWYVLQHVTAVGFYLKYVFKSHYWNFVCSKWKLLYDWRSVSQSVRMSWYRAPFWDSRPDITSCPNVAVWNLRSSFCGVPSLTRGLVCMNFISCLYTDPKRAVMTTNMAVWLRILIEFQSFSTKRPHSLYVDLAEGRVKTEWSGKRGSLHRTYRKNTERVNIAVTLQTATGDALIWNIVRQTNSAEIIHSFPQWLQSRCRHSTSIKPKQSCYFTVCIVGTKLVKLLVSRRALFSSA
jgi:hypothetical protein